ncbi:MAG: family 43 glycosylhydrolase [Bacteroidales bacterium]|nr:family 43 glycosylhydrolase [Bacteroidales bacterium]
MQKISLTIIIISIISCVKQQEVKWDSPENNNPLVPGYFADPTIKKFDGMYYIYSTTDGVKLASGEPTVWISTNLVDWYNIKLEMDLPSGLTNCWAPDVLKGNDGKYYYFMGNCQYGCNIYGYVSENPIGPWKPLNNGEAVIPVGTGAENLPALDAQYLQCENGDLYSYFGTWCHVFKGLGWAKIDPQDMYSILESGYIPNEQLPQLFEAVYPVERNGKYFLIYSAGDCRKSSYAVHYAYANSPTGPFRYGENNPILESNNDFTVDGPGHHSLIEVNNQYYIFYHRHDNPHSSGGEFRQIVADKLVFINDSAIAKITPTHSGIKDFGLGQTRPKNIVLNATVKASSQYHLMAEQSPFTHSEIDHVFKAEFAIDDNNGTLWKASSSVLPQSIVIDLGKKKAIKRIFTEFEYATYYYQYTIEVSSDSLNWEHVADKTNNHICGSPVIDDMDIKGRYIRLTITGTEKAGTYAALWNIKVFSERFDIPSFVNKTNPIGPAPLASNKLEVDFSASELPVGRVINEIENKGALNGHFKPLGNCVIKEIEGIKALYLDGKSCLELTKPAPPTFDWNAPFTVSAWIYVPELSNGHCILLWNSREDMLQSSYAALMFGNGPFGAMAHGDGYVDLGFKNIPPANQWHQITVTFDGMLETIYINGARDRRFPLNLFVKADQVRIGSSGMPSENFVGYIANVQLYNKSLSADEVYKHFDNSKP